MAAPPILERQLTLRGQTLTTHYTRKVLFAMVGFVSTVAFAKFILRGNIIE